MKQNREQNREQIKFKLTSLSGAAEYNLEPLTRKESLKIFHTVSEIFVSGLGTIAEKLTKGKDFDEQTLLSVTRALEFDKVYAIGSAVFRSAVIINEDGKHEIDDLEDSDYFDERPEEFYIAIAHAVRGNWPKTFFALARKLNDFGGSEKTKEVVASLLQKFRPTD